MKELERRAMLGDRKAQAECTRQGIALPCPICREPVKVSVSSMLYACAHCHITVSFNSLYVKPEDTLRIWNTRFAPPFGRCKDCAAFEENKCKNTGYYHPEAGFCHDFSPKEKEI